MYELAYGLVPAPAALRAAIKNRQKAGQDAKAATLSEQLLATYPDDAASQELGNAVIAELSADLSRVAVACDSPCNVSVDGSIATDQAKDAHVFYVEPGSHEVIAAFFGHGDVPRNVETQAGATIELSFEQPPEQPGEMAEPPPAEFNAAGTGTTGSQPADRRGWPRLHPAWFGAAAGLTVVMGAVTVWSGTDVLAKNQDYEDDPTKARYDDGHSAEIRTNALIGVTAALGVTTIVLAIFTDWKGQRKKRGRTPSARVGAGSLHLVGRF
jgi:hypothetical protein